MRQDNSGIYHVRSGNRDVALDGGCDCDADARADCTVCEGGCLCHRETREELGT